MDPRRRALLSTGYTVREDTDSLEGLVGALAERGLAGLAIKLGLYVDAVPEAARAAADRLAFPIVGLPARVMRPADQHH